MNSEKYMDKLRPLTGTGTMYAVAKLMGVSNEAVQGYVRGTRKLDSYACLRVAELLNLPLEQVIADIEATREKDPERRKAWQNLSKKFLGLVPALFVTVIGICGSYADTAQAKNSANPAGPNADLRVLYYVKLLAKRARGDLSRSGLD